jgi:hypothetical protein
VSIKQVEYTTQRFYIVVGVPVLSNGYHCSKMRACQFCSFNLYIVHVRVTIGTKMYRVHLEPKNPLVLILSSGAAAHHFLVLSLSSTPAPPWSTSSSTPAPPRSPSSSTPAPPRSPSPSWKRAAPQLSCASWRQSRPIQVRHRPAPSPTSTRTRWRSSGSSPAHLTAVPLRRWGALVRAAVGDILEPDFLFHFFFQSDLPSFQFLLFCVIYSW